MREGPQLRPHRLPERGRTPPGSLRPRALTQPLENKKGLQAFSPHEAAGVPPPQVLRQTDRQEPRITSTLVLGAATCASGSLSLVCCWAQTRGDTAGCGRQLPHPKG